MQLQIQLKPEPNHHSRLTEVGKQFNLVQQRTTLKYLCMHKHMPYPINSIADAVAESTRYFTPASSD